MLSACIQAVGILGPGIADWPAAEGILRGESVYVPAATRLPEATALPPAERRRAGRVVRLALALGAQAVAAAGANAARLLTVFSSSSGDGDTCHEICTTLASHERALSPTRFHNSVHNAAAGYWSIAHRCPEASTALCAYDASFAAGLLEALAQLAQRSAPLLLVSYDIDYPPPVRRQRPIPDAFGVALLLVPTNGGSAGAPVAAPALAHLTATLTDASVTELGHTELEALRRQIPAARSLPLLELLARRNTGAVVLDYLDGLGLRLEIAA